MDQEGIEATSQIVVSEDEGFAKLETDSVSSLVFIKEAKIYKLGQRNSVSRHIADIRILAEEFADYPHHVARSEVCKAWYQGDTYTCVVQDLIEGVELAKLSEEQLREALRANKSFLLHLLNFFFTAIAEKRKYPDPVGWPKDQEYTNAINLLYEKSTDRIILCDVGLSPHEDTLRKYGEDFFESENVRGYQASMKRFQSFLESL